MGGVARVITVSDRAAAGVRDDRSGPLAAELLCAAGWASTVVVVPDEREQIADAVRHAIAEGARIGNRREVGGDIEWVRRDLGDRDHG